MYETIRSGVICDALKYFYLYVSNSTIIYEDYLQITLTGRGNKINKYLQIYDIN